MRSARQGWYATAVFFVLYLFASMDRTVISLLAKPIMQDLKLDSVEMGTLMGPAFGICYALCAVPFAWLSNRMSRRWLVCICVLIWAVAAIGSGLARSYGELFAMRMMVGVGEAALLPSGFVLVSAIMPKERLALALSVLSLGSMVGFSAAAALGGALLDASAHLRPIPFVGPLEPWRWTFVLTGAPCLLLAFLVLTIREDRVTATAGDRSSEGGDFALLFAFLRGEGRPLLGAVLGFALVGQCSYALMSWLPTYFVNELGFTIAAAGGALGLMMLTCGAAGQIVSGLVVDTRVAKGRRHPQLGYFLPVIVLAIPALAAGFLLPRPSLALPILALYFLLPFANLGYGAAFVQVTAPLPLRALVSAMFLLVINMTSSLGPPLTGWVAENVFTGPQALGRALLLCCTAALVLAAITVAMSMRQRGKVGAPATVLDPTVA